MRCLYLTFRAGPDNVSAPPAPVSIEDEYDRQQRQLEFNAVATAAAERAEREQAALDTMNQVLHLPAAPGRGVNNALTVSEVRSVSAFLLSTLPAFKTRAGERKCRH